MTAPSVLVVDDNDINRQIVVHLLDKIGVSVGQAADGQEALRMVLAETFDLVLMDIQMPGMDGIETTRRIRAEGLSEVPIIAFTAPFGVTDAQTYIGYGMNGLLVKPLDPSELMKLVQQWVHLPTGSGTSLDPAVAEALAQTDEIDVSNLLARADGDAAFATERLRNFIEVYSDLSDDLGPAIAVRDRATVSRLMLSLRLPCLDIAANGLAREAHAIGLNIRRSDATFVRVETFHARFDTCLAVIAEAVFS